MSSAFDLISRLRKDGVTLSVDNDRLRILSPAGTVTPELREELIRHKEEIIGLLKNASALSSTDIPAILPAEKAHNLPLSFAQERLWFLDQLEGQNATYNIPVVLRLDGNLDVPQLQRCLEEVLRRHETLRTRFETIEAQPVQIIEPFAPLDMPLVDLISLPQSQRESQAIKLGTEEARRPFDLKKGNMIKARLFRLEPTAHILLLTMHHIASDGWSIGLLFREIQMLYTAFLENKPSPLPELPVQYADFVIWQRQWLQGEVLQKQLDYWKKQLNGAPALLELPADRPRPPIQSYRGTVMWKALPKSLMAPLKELSRAEGATLFMTMLAAFQTLLYRYTGSQDIIVGTPIAGRHYAEIEKLIGFFVNTLIMRGDLSESFSFKTLLSQTRTTALEAYANQDVPFERLVDQLHPQRDVSYSPVFQVLFAFQNTPWEKPSLPGLEVSPIALDSGTSKFDLSLIIKERDGTLQIVMEYSTDLFNAQTIERMLAHYETLLKGIISNPCQQLSKLPLLTDEERRQILVNWNNTESAYAENRSVYELFEEQVEEAPDAVAVLFENQSLTYRQLNARANQLAWHLQELGVRPDSLVGICVERSLEMIIGLLGILKAGGAYVPLDPEYPKDRLAFMLEDSSVTVLLTQDHLVGTLPASPARLIRLDTDWPAIASQISINVEHTATAKNLAYMIYTSGSTGRPKGVLVEHGPLTEHCLECRDFYGLTSKDRVLQFASLSFDAALEQILPPLLSGACVVLRPTLVWSPVEFQQRLIELRLTVINLPPAYWHEIAEAWSTSPKPMRGHQLRLVIIGGDAMLPQTLKLWQQTPFKEVRLLNAYGPTETIITATTFEVSSSREPLQRIPIGKKRGNRLCYMMDRWGQLVPIGVPGELHIGGAWLARGYHNRPELTAEKFIPNSFSADPKARLYKTGDLARFLPDGNIEYLGRLDHQVKIRGFRIELGEIEEVLNQYHGIRTSIVAAQEDVPGNKRLVGYIVSRNGPIDTAELREYLRGKLPDYMVPATFVTLDSLPLTPNGKVNRKALPKPEFEPQADKFVPPTTPTEIALAKIWCEVLGLKQVSIHDNFFDVGGHSLLAVRLINRINKSLSLDLSIPIFFHNTTIKGLATVLDRGNYSIREPKLIQLLPGSSARTIYLLDISIGLCRLAQHLEDTELAIFGTTVPLSRETFQSAAQNEMDKLPSLQDLAATHTALIKNHQSSGPCFLAGHSFGGLLAFEVAHQLQREGRQVEMIFLLDCWATSPPWWKKLKVLSLARAQESLKFRTSHLWSNTRTKITRMIRPSFSVSESGGMLALDLDEINRPIGDAPWEIWKRIYQNARKHYQLFSLESRAILFRAEHSDMAHLYPIHEDLGWGGLFGQGLQIMKVPGDHFTLLKEPEVLTLAQKFRECLGNLPAQVEGFPKASVPMKKENLPSVVPK